MWSRKKSSSSARYQRETIRPRPVRAPATSLRRCREYELRMCDHLRRASATVTEQLGQRRLSAPWIYTAATYRSSPSRWPPPPKALSLARRNWRRACCFASTEVGAHAPARLTVGRPPDWNLLAAPPPRLLPQPLTVFQCIATCLNFLRYHVTNKHGDFLPRQTVVRGIVLPLIHLAKPYGRHNKLRRYLHSDSASSLLRI